MSRPGRPSSQPNFHAGAALHRQNTLQGLRFHGTPALSCVRAAENCSLLSLPPWSNPWLLAAIAVSVVLHLLILYTPPLAAMFRCVGYAWAGRLLRRGDGQLSQIMRAPVLGDHC